MKTIVLISCMSKKLSVKARASDLYISPLFRLNLQYARQLQPDAIFILSAKYGLVGLDDIIASYDMTLNTMGAVERRAWVATVIGQLSEHADLRRDHFVFLAGERYRQYLLPHLASYAIPHKGLSIGHQLQVLKRACHE